MKWLVWRDRRRRIRLMSYMAKIDCPPPQTTTNVPNSSHPSHLKIVRQNDLVTWAIMITPPRAYQTRFRRPDLTCDLQVPRVWPSNGHGRKILPSLLFRFPPSHYFNITVFPTLFSRESEVLSVMFQTPWTCWLGNHEENGPPIHRPLYTGIPSFLPLHCCCYSPLQNMHNA